MASAAPKTLELPQKLRVFYDKLDGQGDVPILDIYEAVNGEREKDLRSAQQRLGYCVTRLNRRLREHRKAVKPGRLKGTYCLTAL